MRITRQKPCSRHSDAHCAWRWNPMRALPVPSPPLKDPCNLLPPSLFPGMTDIAIVDYGMGNLRSVSKALEHVAPGVSIAVTDDPELVRQAGRVVVPGQGAMPDCLHELDA